MNYYYDCEFLEGKQKERFPISLFRKETLPTIDLISIGIVSEDGREYYAISKDFNLKEAWNRFDLKETHVPMNKPLKKGSGVKKVYWIRENVLKSIWRQLYQKGYGVMAQIEIMSGAYDSQFTYKILKKLIEKHGKTNKQIAEEVKDFVIEKDAYETVVCPEFYYDDLGKRNANERLQKGELVKTVQKLKQKSEINLYGYYSAYDHVCLSWLFGKMMDLPEGFPKYTRDLKQIMDEYAEKVPVAFNMDEGLKAMKFHQDYPKQENEHSAIHDARWNKKLHEFLKSL